MRFTRSLQTQELLLARRPGQCRVEARPAPSQAPVPWFRGEDHSLESRFGRWLLVKHLAVGLAGRLSPGKTSWGEESEDGSAQSAPAAAPRTAAGPVLPAEGGSVQAPHATAAM